MRHSRYKKQLQNAGLYAHAVKLGDLYDNVLDAAKLFAGKAKSAKFLVSWTKRAFEVHRCLYRVSGVKLYNVCGDKILDLHNLVGRQNYDDEQSRGAGLDDKSNKSELSRSEGST
jgi:hypothetical protein